MGFIGFRVLGLGLRLIDLGFRVLEKTEPDAGSMSFFSQYMYLRSMYFRFQGDSCTAIS